MADLFYYEANCQVIWLAKLDLVKVLEECHRASEQALVGARRDSELLLQRHVLVLCVCVGILVIGAYLLGRRHGGVVVQTSA